jgi:shikimate 5-dehydrogenase
VTAGTTGATRVYLHLAHPSAHARTPQVMNAEFARRGVVTRPEQTLLLDEATARGCVPHPGLPMLEGQVDLILDFPGLSGNQPG